MRIKPCSLYPLSISSIFLVRKSFHKRYITNLIFRFNSKASPKYISSQHKLINLKTRIKYCSWKINGGEDFIRKRLMKICLIGGQNVTGTLARVGKNHPLGHSSSKRGGRNCLEFAAMRQLARDEILGFVRNRANSLSRTLKASPGLNTIDLSP